MSPRPIVTIDGPSGAGKTTVAKRLAALESLLRLDTGAMYRAAALAARRAGIPWDDGRRLEPFCRGLAIGFEPRNGEIAVLLGAEDVSKAIRTPEISMGASDVSKHAGVREAMVALQRTMGARGGVVAEGRDTGTVVFPDAGFKFFLDAAAAVRAQRRFLEWRRDNKGKVGPAFEEVLKDVLRRDVQDSTRDHSPLRVAEGAVYIDSTIMTVDEVVGAIRRRMGKP